MRTFIGAVFLFCSTLWAQSLPPQSLTQGAAALEKGQIEEARTHFQNILDKEPHNLTALYNLSLTESKAGRHGLALALLRKALGIDPNFIPAEKALPWVQKKLEHPIGTADMGTWDVIRSQFARPYSVFQLGLTTLLFSFVSAWLLLRYFGARRRALQDEAPLPPWPTVATLLLPLAFVGLILTAAKWSDQTIVRATAIEKQISLRSSPEKNSTALADLFEGAEVTVQQSNEDWLQVSLPDSTTGWAPKASFYITSERQP